jgi:hypothetical protein
MKIVDLGYLYLYAEHKYMSHRGYPDAIPYNIAALIDTLEINWGIINASIEAVTNTAAIE